VRSYGQYCAVARSLDVIGDRWTMLIVRELWLRPCRYTDLRQALPGIATNLLADRLRDLEADGLVQRTEEPPPVATTVYRLTERGRALEPVLYELARWGTPLMASGRGDDTFRPHWLGLVVRRALRDVPATAPFRFSLTLAGSTAPALVAYAGEDGVQVDCSPASDVAVDVALEGEADDLIAVFRGTRKIDGLVRAGSPANVRKLRELLARRKAPVAS
jgi:DNA-binding HxlR family transcriptional regulator